MSQFGIFNRLKVTNANPNVDLEYGPWSSSAAAASSVPNRRSGKTVGVLNSGSVVEYWWKSATGDSDLVEKIVVNTDSIGSSAITTEKMADSSVTTAKVVVNNITLEKLEQIQSYRVLGNTTAASGNVQEITVLDEDDLTSNSSTSLATQQSVKTYVDTARDRYGVQTLTVGSTSAAASVVNTTPLVIAATADFIELTRDSIWQPASVTGFIKNKEITIQINTSASAAYPYQITFPSNIKLNDGVGLLIKNNSSTTFDEITIRGINSASGQIIGDVTYGG